MTRTPYAVLAALAMLVCACDPPTPNYPYDKEPDPRKQEYVIGPSDTLAINVWNQDRIGSGAIAVRPDGTVTLALIGDLQAAGRTPTELRDEIKRRLAAFVKDENAVVTVAVTATNSYKYTVAGNVEAPGVYGSTMYVTVIEAISQAGGVNRYGNSERVVIQRRDKKGKIRRIPVNLKLITSGKRLDMNLFILPGDTIIVP